MSTPNLALAFNLPPERAVEYFRSRGMRIAGDWKTVATAVRSGSFSVAGVMKAQVLDDIRGALQDAIDTGQTYDDFKRGLVPKLQAAGWWGRWPADPETGEILPGKGIQPRRLETIFRTNVQGAYMAGRYKGMVEASDSHPFWMYSAVMDGRTRPAHQLLNGRVFRWDDPVWNVIYPPNGYNCFPAGTPVRGKAEVGLKTFYAGKMVELHTRLGHRLTVTANHPVLTGRGWLPARLIQKGDQTLGATGEVDAKVVGVVNDEQPPALAEDLFEALAAQGLRIVPMAPHDFHADAYLRKPEIEIATADRRLMDEIDAEAQQFVRQRQFGAADAAGLVYADFPGRATQRRGAVLDSVFTQEAADVAETGSRLSGDGAFGGQPGAVERENAPFDVGVFGVGGLPGCAALAGHGGGVGLDGGPLDSLRLGAAAQFDALLAEQAVEHGTVATSLLGELLEANPGAIALDEVVEIRQFDWSGHVYDFQTDTGLMIAGGVIIHNCRCRVRPLTQADMKRKGLALSKGGPMDTVTVDLGKRGGKIDVTGYRDPATGQRFAPDPGFDHNPSAAWSLDVELARRVATIRSPEIRAQTWQALNNAPERKAAWLDMVDAVLASRGDAVRPAGHDGFVLGFVDDAIADFARTMAPDKAPVRVVAMSRQGLLHADTGKHLDEGIALTRDQYAMLPNVVARPDEILWDRKHGTLVYVVRLVDGTAIYLPVMPEWRLKKLGAVDAAVNAYRILASHLNNPGRFVRMGGGG